MVENVIQIKSRIKINAVASEKIKKKKKNCVCKNNYIWNLAKCSCKNDKYLARIIDNLVITCDEIIDAEANSYNEETRNYSNKF